MNTYLGQRGGRSARQSEDRRRDTGGEGYVSNGESDRATQRQGRANVLTTGSRNAGRMCRSSLRPGATAKTASQCAQRLPQTRGIGWWENAARWRGGSPDIQRVNGRAAPPATRTRS
jgi:hypothetical protein